MWDVTAADVIAPDDSVAAGAPDTPPRALAMLSARDLLEGLLEGRDLMAVVPLALTIVERDPLASGGCFPGDLVRGLMEISGHFWGRHPRLYERYVHALRASAIARRALPREERMVFWSALDPAHLRLR